MIQKNKKIQKIASKILKGRTKEFGAEVFAKPAKVGLQSPIHQDNFYWNIKSNKGITMWIALDEANKKMDHFIILKNLINWAYYLTKLQILQVAHKKSKI